jgi:ubiquitin carboxyl-terminal hydrolase 4/11/15
MSDPPTPPPAEEQASTIKQLLQTTKLKVGDKAYLILKSWVDNWKASVKYNGYSVGHRTCGPIDNSSLLIDGEVSATKYETCDFLVFPQEPWSKLYDWYGGGPVIEVPVVQATAGPTAAIRKTSLKLRFKDQEKVLRTSKYVKVGDFRQTVNQAFGLSADAETRLIDFWASTFREVLDDDKTINSYSIYENQLIVLDEKVDGNWGVSKPKRADSTRDPIYSHTTVSSTPGICGLENLGNTCYFNSGTQCLLHSAVFVSHFLANGWEADLNPTNPIGAGGKVARAFADLARFVWTGRSGAARPSSLKHAMSRFATQFDGWDQQDSHELITFMLDGIHEDLNRCKVKGTVTEVCGDGTDDAARAAEAWTNHKKRNDSIVVDNFHAQLRSHLTCPNCSRSTVVFDPYVAISVPLARRRPTSISVLFVPLDFAARRVQLQVALPPRIDNESLSAAVSELIGRPVKVVVAAIRSAEYLSWDLSWIGTHGAAPEYVAFEVRSAERFYVPCTVKMNVKSPRYLTVSSKSVSGIFMVEFESDAVKLEDIENAAVETLACLWDGSETVVTPYMQILMDAISLPTAELPGGKRLLAKLPMYQAIRRERIVPFVSATSVSLEIGAAFVAADSSFSLAALVRHFRAPAGAPGQAGEMSLQQCFEMFSTAETLDEQNKWFCPHCREFVRARKKMDVWSVPPQLIIHLKRFTSTEKIGTFVDFPGELDMGQYVVGPQKDRESLRYRLYGVSEHMGGMHGGHYTAHAVVREPGKAQGQWYSFDDSWASPSTEEQAKTKAAYVLFYEKVEEVNTSAPATQSQPLKEDIEPDSDSE